MGTPSYHVVPNGDGGWGVRRSGSDRMLRNFDTKTQAGDYGQGVARNQGAELFYHRKDGTFQRRDSYGNDPYPPRG